LCNLLPFWINHNQPDPIAIQQYLPGDIGKQFDVCFIVDSQIQDPLWLDFMEIGAIDDVS
jgi:hypothetical protein